MEKQRDDSKQKPSGGGIPFKGVALPDEPVNVSSGPYAEALPVAGLSVGDIREKFSDRFDLDPKAQAVVDGNQVGDKTILKGGQSLMFIRPAGEKGTR